MSKTLITWPPGSADGEREANRLHALYADVSDAIAGSHLPADNPGTYSTLIVVGHRSEIQAIDTLKSLARGVKSLGISRVVMANCNSAVRTDGPPLGDNELWSPAQRLANASRAVVAATTRELGFAEVGESLAFARDAEHGIAPVGDLWRQVDPQSDIDEITEGLGNL